MADTYVRLPVDGDYPKYYATDPDLTAFVGNTVANSPRYVGHIYGTQTAIDLLVANADVTELTESEFVSEMRASGNVPADAVASDFTVG